MQKSRFIKIIADTGFGFAFVSFLFYSSTSTLGMCTTLASLMLIAAVKLQHDTTARQWVRDPRTPLRISGSGLLFLALCIALQSVIGTAEASSAKITGVQGMTIADIAPFFSALFFGTANMMLASQLADNTHKPLPLMRNPETFLFLGYIAVGFLSGISALYVMPLVLTAFVITMYNYRHQKCPTHYHPVLIYALAELCFGAVALHEGKMMVFMADILCAICLVRVDIALNPQGVQAYARIFTKYRKENSPPL